MMRKSGTTVSDENKFIYPSHSGQSEVMDMIKILSHDVRSPLITIAAGLKLLKKGAYGQVEKGVIEELEKLYEIVIKTAGNMEDFMERAFYMEEDLDSPHEPLDLFKDIVSPVLIELQKEIREGKVSLENHIDIPQFYNTVGSRFLLKAVFRNLLRNALKYGGKGCKISMGINESGAFYKINVFNTGDPVPVEKRKMLFRKYCRIVNTDKINPDGMGLGLFLVRKILKSHNGIIRYKAEENSSNFIFSLPKYKKQIISEDSLEQFHFNNSVLSQECNFIR